MATIEKKVSDLSGDEGDVETISFGLDGTDYDVDLTPSEAAKLRDTMHVYVSNGRRRVKYQPASFPSSKPKTRKRDPEQIRAMKDWLRANGYEFPSRGRIGKDLEEAYNTQTPAVVEEEKQTSKK